MKLKNEMTTEMARTAWITTLLGKPETEIKKETEQLLLDLMDIVEQSDFEHNVRIALNFIKAYCKCECNIAREPDEGCCCNPKCECAPACGCGGDCDDCEEDEK